MLRAPKALLGAHCPLPLHALFHTPVLWPAMAICQAAAACHASDFRCPVKLPSPRMPFSPFFTLKSPAAAYHCPEAILELKAPWVPLSGPLLWVHASCGRPQPTSVTLCHSSSQPRAALACELLGAGTRVCVSRTGTHAVQPRLGPGEELAASFHPLGGPVPHPMVLGYKIPKLQSLINFSYSQCRIISLGKKKKLTE